MLYFYVKGWGHTGVIIKGGVIGRKHPTDAEQRSSPI